jgi:hypothetical protein
MIYQSTPEKRSDTLPAKLMTVMATTSLPWQPQYVHVNGVGEYEKCVKFKLLGPSGGMPRPSVRF